VQQASTKLDNESDVHVSELKHMEANGDGMECHCNTSSTAETMHGTNGNSFSMVVDVSRSLEG
jgi:hypothetical protein